MQCVFLVICWQCTRFLPRFDSMFLFQVSQLEGVYSVQEPHFWTLCSEVYIGTIKLEVAMNADTRYILSQTHNIFTQVRIIRWLD